jgi:hypothetical protein
MCQMIDEIFRLNFREIRNSEYFCEWVLKIPGVSISSGPFSATLKKLLDILQFFFDPINMQICITGNISIIYYMSSVIMAFKNILEKR